MDPEKETSMSTPREGWRLSSLCWERCESCVSYCKADPLFAPDYFEDAESADPKWWGTLSAKVKEISNGAKRNVIVFGKLKAGKTTFLNTLLTAFSAPFGEKNDIQHVEIAHGSDEHITKKVTHRRLDFSYDEKKRGEFGDITLVDTWGWKEAPDANYQKGEFKLILKGNIKKEWKMNYTPDEKKDDKKCWNATPRKNDEIHGAICVIAADMVANDANLTSPFYLQLKKFLKEAAELKLYPVALLSKVDLVDSELSGEGYKAVYSSNKLHEVYHRLYKIGFVKTQIFPCKLYHDVHYRQPHVEITVMRCLIAALKNEKPDDSHHRRLVFWTKEDIQKWLREKKLSEYKENFRSIDGSMLQNIDSDKELEALGIESSVDRHRILRAIKKLLKNSFRK